MTAWLSWYKFNQANDDSPVVVKIFHGHVWLEIAQPCDICGYLSIDDNGKPVASRIASIPIRTGSQLYLPCFVTAASNPPVRRSDTWAVERSAEASQIPTMWLAQHLGPRMAGGRRNNRCIEGERGSQAMTDAVSE